MKLAFDLISDLHLETWPEEFNWQGLATSPFCVVAGDVARDRNIVMQTLQHLSKCYQAVFYIDGNDEHRHYYADLPGSYKDLEKQLNHISNLTYLQGNVVVIDGVAFLGTNGWWGFDFDSHIDPTESALWYQDKVSISGSAIQTIGAMAHTDAIYLKNSVAKLQTHIDVQHIVIVTHTVPSPELIIHDIDLEGSFKFNTMGNTNMVEVLQADHGEKIHTWCFGHYHGSVDQIKHGIRFVNNCQGRRDTKWCQHVYHPLRIEIDV
jgi:hypothetical protein